MNPPIIGFRDTDAIQDCYIDRYNNRYSVARLIDAAKDLKPFDVPIAALDLSSVIWGGCNMYELAFHCKRVIEADLKYPIIIDWNGSIADGRHRILKAIIDGKCTIKAVRITWVITPDQVGE